MFTNFKLKESEITKFSPKQDKHLLQSPYLKTDSFATKEYTESIISKGLFLLTKNNGSVVAYKLAPKASQELLQKLKENGLLNLDGTNFKKE